MSNSVSSNFSTLLALACLACSSVTLAATPSAARHRLEQQQLQDTLDLNLRQSGARSRADLSTTDALRLDQLQLRQRMEQSQLEQQQMQLERLNRNHSELNAAREQRLFAQERQLQIQRFDMEQRELLRTMKPPPLQRPLPDGGLLP
ncbi:MAG TPA: hypothetical protein VGC70_10665 [Burkholderiales bacterium]